MIILWAANSFAQGHFILPFTGNGQDHMNLTVVTATIGGVALEAGDEIAAFDGTICCGKVILTQSIALNTPITFAALVSSRKDDGQSNGYTVGNTITYKFWDSSKSLEISGIFAEYFDNTGTTFPAPTFSPTADTFFVKLTVAAPVNADHLPYVKNPIKDVSADKRAPNQTIDLKTIFADEDVSDLLSYVVTLNSNVQVVTAEITGFNLTLSFSIENTGLSEIEITASSNGKEAKSKFQVQVNIPTGTDPMISDQKFIVFPNPTSEKIKVTFELIPENGTYLTVNDVTGKTILKQLIQDKEEWIDLKGNPPGIYLIKANLNNLKVQKVILK